MLIQNVVLVIKEMCMLATIKGCPNSAALEHEGKFDAVAVLQLLSRSLCNIWHDRDSPGSVFHNQTQSDLVTT